MLAYLRSRLATAILSHGEIHVVPVILPPEINPKDFGRNPMHYYGIWFLQSGLLPNPLRIANALHTQQEMVWLQDIVTGTAVRFQRLVLNSSFSYVDRQAQNNCPDKELSVIFLLP